MIPAFSYLAGRRKCLKSSLLDMRLYQRGWAQRERERERAGVDEIINSGQWENSDLRGGQNRKTRFEMLTDKDKVIDDGDGRTDGGREGETEQS